MPRPVGYGRPGTPVFPPDWQATHGVVLETTLDCTVEIGPPTGGAPAWNPVTEQSEATPGTPVYTGPASIAVVSDTDRTVDAVDDMVPTREYFIALPVDTAGIDADEHTIRVTDCPDPMLTGQSLAITGIVRGGRRFSRILRATLND